MHLAYIALHYTPSLHTMVIAGDTMFPSTNIAARFSAGHVVGALLASDGANTPSPLPLEAEGGVLEVHLNVTRK